MNKYLVYRLSYEGPRYLFTAVGDPITALKDRGYLYSNRSYQLVEPQRPLFDADQSGPRTLQVKAGDEPSLLFVLPVPPAE